MVRLQIDPPILRQDELRWLPIDEIGSLVDSNWIIEDATSHSADCDGCGVSFGCRIVFVHSSETSKAQAIICCPECGSHPVELNDLKRWRVDISKILKSVHTALKMNGASVEVRDGCLWKLGTASLGGKAREVYFVRRRAGADDREDGWIVEELRTHLAAVLLMPTERDILNWKLRPDGNPIFALESIFSGNPLALECDRDTLNSRITELAASAKPRRQPNLKKRRRIDAAIQMIQNEYFAHFDGSRKKVWDDIENGRTPTALPLPTGKELAERLTLSEPMVTRCFKDSRFLSDLKAKENDIEFIKIWKRRK